MSTSLGGQQMAQLIEHVAVALEAAHPYLTQLDAAMGDGDHGVSMTIGFRAVRKALAGKPHESVADVLQQAGTVFQAAAGATVGALLGAATTSAAGALRGRDALAAEDLARAFRAATDAVMRLGGAQPGDKTLVDCLHPAAAEVERAVAEGQHGLAAFERGLHAAREGMEATRTLVARKGRASRLGERTLGHIDPGAASSLLILQSAFEFLQQARGTPAAAAT
jgi:phosphoenolpyruvate---glycerone phosphotransferase subunit DhaL